MKSKKKKDPNEIPERIIDKIHNLTFPKFLERGIQKGTERAEGII